MVFFHTYTLLVCLLLFGSTFRSGLAFSRPHFRSKLPMTQTSELASSDYPPDFTIEDDDTGPSDFVFDEAVEPQVNAVSSSPTRRPRPTSPTRTLSQASWMDRNQKFTKKEVNSNVEVDAHDRRGPGATDSPRRNNNDGSKPGRLSFRQDFRGTRVFVQGIPPSASWQDLKDHFRIAGNVVFASVSSDPVTGESRGHGIVQYETTEMAQTAIAIMRNHPMEDGFKLYVREDVQEAKAGAELKRKGPTPPSKWKCADESTVDDYLDEAEVKNIRALIKARDQARRRRNYESSDSIREQLKMDYGVHLDDRLRMWWLSMDGNSVPQRIKDIKGEGRWGKQSPWRQIPTTPELDACVSADLVEGFLKQRDIARREKDFHTADELLEEVRACPDGDLTLRIHDETRTWRVWSPEKPVFTATGEERQCTQRPMRDEIEGIEIPRSAAEMCLELVEDYAPEKYDEVSALLKQFQGKEEVILKKLQERYLE